MCGITLVLERDDAAATKASHTMLCDACLVRDVEKRLCQRGPDHFSVVDRSISLAIGLDGEPSSRSSSWTLRLCSAVLHLRGDTLTPQPMQDAGGNILCWNGEVFGYRDAQGSAVDIERGNDTRWLSDLLFQRSDGIDDDAHEVTQRTVDVLRRIRGPFAFVWFHAASQRLFFGHDRFGRRSLLCHTDAPDLLPSLASSLHSGTVEICDLQRLVLSSVALSHAESYALQFDEVPSTGIFVLDLATQQFAFYAHTPLVSPTVLLPLVSSSMEIPMVQDRYECGLPVLSDVVLDSPIDRAALGLLTALSNAVGVRVRTIPANAIQGAARVGVLFSGGLDSVVLAALAHFHLADPTEPIDLLNVCFDAGSQFQSPDRLAARVSHRELGHLFPTRTWRLVCVDELYEDVLQCQDELLALLRPCDTHMDFNIGAAFWCLSRGRGSVAIDVASTCSAGNELEQLNGFLTLGRVASKQKHGEAAVRELGLFAQSRAVGGFCPANKCKRKLKPGCTLGVCRVCCFKAQKLLAKLSHYGEANAHEVTAWRKQLASMGAVDETSSDHGLARIDQLLEVYTSHWSSPKIELCRVHRNKKVGDDDSVITNSENEDDASTLAAATHATEYTTTARVLLVGIGADEQLGGYGRHKTAFLNGGAQALQRELARDMERIWKRNLGRDDRCISAHGREARFPFLDERVVQYIASLPLDVVCDFAQARGQGDKRVLRRAAQLLGLVNCAGLAKRAIQFGSRIAKHANVAAFGSNRQASGAAKIAARGGGQDDE